MLETNRLLLFSQIDKNFRLNTILCLPVNLFRVHWKVGFVVSFRINNNPFFIFKIYKQLFNIFLDMPHSLICNGDNPDITKERRNARFDYYELSKFIHGGEQILKRRQEILEFVESKPEFRDPIPIEFMSREQVRIQQHVY